MKVSVSFDADTEQRILRIFQQLNIPLVKIDDFKSEKFREFIIKLDEKLLLDNSSLAPNSPSGEQKPPITKTSEQKLYDQYLKDTSYIDFSKIPKPSENPEPKTESSLLSPLQWVQDHTCHYRAVVKEKGGSFSIYCDTKKIPLEVCVTRQKRFLFMKKNCKPIGYKPPQKQWQQRTQQDDRTRPYKGDTEAYFDPFSVGDGYQ